MVGRELLAVCGRELLGLIVGRDDSRNADVGREGLLLPYAELGLLWNAEVGRDAAEPGLETDNARRTAEDGRVTPSKLEFPPLIDPCVAGDFGLPG